MRARAWTSSPALPLILVVSLGLLGCRKKSAGGETGGDQPATKDSTTPGVEAEEAEGESETGGALGGEASHVIPFADRTSMGYLLLLPPGADKPELPSREYLQQLVRLAFPDRRRDGEIDLLLTLIATEPHATDLPVPGALEPPSLPEGEDEGADEPEDEGVEPPPTDPAELEELAAKLERQRSFDLIGLHIELIRLGVGDEATIPSAAMSDPVLTRELDPEQRASLPGRSWALLLRADYRNVNAVRGLRLHQTLVRVVAEHFDALVHDPDTLETMDVEAFHRRRLRAAAGNIADQIAIVPIPDPADPEHLWRLATRGMRRFGSVDLELAGLPGNPRMLQQGTDLLTGLALLMVKEGEVHPSGYAVEVPEVLEVDGSLIRQSYSESEYEPSLCEDCPGVVSVHLVERSPEDHDPRDHVVARVVAPRPQSDAPDYDHPQWVRSALERLFGPASAASREG